MIGFEPSADQKMMVQAVSQFAKTTLRPRIREFERARALPDEVRATAREMGLGSVALPESCGGAGLGMVTAVLVEEEVAYGDPAAAFGFAGPGAFGLALSELASPEVAARYLAPYASEPDRFGAVAWGEPRAHRERAGLVSLAWKSDDTWILSGQKAYVLSADRASDFLVFAQLDESKGWGGLGAFVVERGAKGLTVTARQTTLGLDVASFGGLSLDGVVVREEDRVDLGNGDALVRFFARNALLIAAREVGLARAAFELTRDYVEQRKAFGKPIGHFQAVAFNLADRSMDLDAARSMVWRAASAWDTKDPAALLHTALAISFTHEAAMRAGDDAVQLHGGSGFMRDYMVEKLMRDAKQLQLCAMTAEQADQLAAAVELGRPLDPGLVLPSAESQNAFV